MKEVQIDPGDIVFHRGLKLRGKAIKKADMRIPNQEWWEIKLVEGGEGTLWEKSNLKVIESNVVCAGPLNAASKMHKLGK